VRVYSGKNLSCSNSHLSPLPLVKGRGDRTPQHKSRLSSGSEMTSVVLFEAEGLVHLLPFGGAFHFAFIPQN
jgi:hypothetical protein